MNLPPIRTAKPPQRHTELLVSVRCRAEFDAILGAGVSIIDLKEPRNGALAPASLDLQQYAAQQAAGHSDVKISAAMGEAEQAGQIAARLPAPFAFAKVGPSGCSSPASLTRLWTQNRQRLNSKTELVAVAYADHTRADCLDPIAVLEQAVTAGFRRFLIDTFEKDGSSTLDHLPIDELRRLNRMAGAANMWWALAGSIRLEHVGQLSSDQVYPDCFGVRGDVCTTGRTSALSINRVLAWQEALASTVHQ